MWFMLVSGEWLILRGGGGRYSQPLITLLHSLSILLSGIKHSTGPPCMTWFLIDLIRFDLTWLDLTWLYAKSDVYYLWFPRTEFNIYHLHCTSTALLREIKFHKPVNLPGLKSTRGMKVVDLSLHFSFHRPLYLYLITTSAYSFPFRFLIFFSVLTLSHLPYPLPSCLVLFCSVLCCSTSKVQRYVRFGAAGLIVCSSTRLEDVPAADTFSVEDTLSVSGLV